MLYGDFFMKKYLADYIRENSKMITIFLTCMLIGIVSGIIMYNFSSEEVKEELNGVIVSTLNISKEENFEGINVIMNGLQTNIIIVLLIYFSTITIISPVLISLLNFLKGISIGVYIPIIFSIFGGANGALTVLLLLVVPNIFYVPAYIFLSTNALNLHYIIMESEEKNKLKILISQLTYIIIGFSFIFISVLFEQIFSGNIISIYKGLWWSDIEQIEKTLHNFLKKSCKKNKNGVK